MLNTIKQDTPLTLEVTHDIFGFECHFWFNKKHIIHF